MYLADYHTHSRVSPDGHVSMLEMASAALEAGLNEICFTDHFEPVEPRTTIPRKTFDWAAQKAEYADVTARWNGPVKLRLGLELGDSSVDEALVERLLVGMPELDFIIGSVHMLSKKFKFQDLAWIQEPDEKTCYAELEDYLENMLQMARWGKFTVLGHMTLPMRYMNDKRGFHVSMDGYGAEVEAILRTLIENGCGIEVNTNRGGQPLPGARWLKLYRRLGGEIITLGSDAHRPEDVGRGIREGQALLRECGFTRFCTFEKTKPIWYAL
ncbi:histidinol phosphate phosphatase family protein [Oscillibacter valericigenes Sjm18-20]|nr:histidinol phosphate phosphatase family protein [Oscillibacter valericigenes Sjm18-20]